MLQIPTNSATSVSLSRKHQGSPSPPSCASKPAGGMEWAEMGWNGGKIGTSGGHARGGKRAGISSNGSCHSILPPTHSLFCTQTCASS